jgi:hypothetical protein
MLFRKKGNVISNISVVGIVFDVYLKNEITEPFPCGDSRLLFSYP